MAGKGQVRRQSWYSLGLLRPEYLTVWIALSVTLALSTFDLINWIRGIEFIRQLPFDWIPMQLSAAMCFIFAATAIILQKLSIPALFRRFLPAMLAMFIALISLWSLYNGLFNNITGKGLFFDLIMSPSIRMTLLVAGEFILISCVILLLPKKPGLAQFLNISVSLVSYFFLLSYILGVQMSIAGLVPPSFNTSIALAALCTAVFMINPRTWLVRVFVSGYSGGIIARQMLLPLIIIPIFIGWLRITGEMHGLFSSEVGIVLVALAYTSCFIFLVWLAARSVNKIDQKRAESEEASMKSHARLELLSVIASRLLINENPQKIVNELCQEIKEFLDCEVYFNYLLDETTGKLHLNASGGISPEAAKDIGWLEPGTAVCDCVALDGERIVAECIQESVDQRTALVRQFGVRAYACHPLLSHQKVMGTLSFGSKKRNRFSSDDLSLMKIAADQVAIAMSRVQNEIALRESEDRFRTIAEYIPVLISITRISNSTVRFTNEAYNLAFGYKRGELTGKKAQDMYFDPDERLKIIDRIKAEGSVTNIETKVKRADGSPFWIMASIRQIIFEGEPSYLSAITDIDDRKKAQEKLIHLNRTLNALGKSSHVMMHSTNELEYLREVCKIITNDCGYLMVWIGYARNDPDKSVEPMAYYGFDRGYIEKMKVTWEDSERGRGPTGTAIRTGKPAICINMQTDPLFAPWRDEAVKRGYASSVVLPLTLEGQVFGAISIYSKDSDSFSEDDVNLLSDLANDMSYGISNLRLMESERKAARTISESEEKYRLLFEEMIEGFALHEMILDDHGHPFDYRFVSVNPAFEKQTGLKAEQVIGRTAKEVLPSTEKHWIENYGRVALTGESMNFENYASDLKAYFRVSAFCPRKGFFAVIFENITNRIKAEKELHSTKNYLENLINYANAPIIVWNPATEIQLFNHAFEHLTGYTSAEMLGRKLDLLFPAASLEDSNKKIKIALTRNWETLEIPILTKDNKIKTVLWNSANIYDVDNHTILSTIAQGHDITERIQAEREVRTAKEKLDLALENANIGIWTWDVKNDNFDWDERIGRMFGLGHNTESRHYEDFEKNIFEEDISHFNKAIDKALKEDIPLDTIFRTKMITGEYKYIDAKARVEKDVQGKPVKMTGVCLDITATKKSTEKSLFNLNEDLLRSNKELEQFAYVASHDLQEPLRMVSSFTQLLSMRYKDKLDKEAQEFIGFAVDGAQRMQRLINDLLQYSRIKTRGKNLSVINMNEILTQTLHNLNIKIREKKARVTMDQLPEVYADDGQMVQLFQNLIENAIKFCDKKPRIHISCTEEEDFFVFTVKDNGIGIEPQYFDRVFQIFQRLHSREEYGGTGIGLAICKRIVERHGGKIWVEPGQREGTIFKFTIRKG